MRTRKPLLLIVFCAAALLWAGRARAEMIRELVTLQGAAPIPVSGMGIVTGLAGTGDKNAAALELMREYLSNNNMNFELASLARGNIALVKVSAEITPFSRAGQKFPVYVSSAAGDTKSLEGGILMECDLYDGNAQIDGRPQEPVARAGGRVLVGKNHLTTGVVPGGNGSGALQLVAYNLGKVVSNAGIIRLNLNKPNWADAKNIARQVNLSPALNPNVKESVMFSETAPAEPVAYAKDMGQVLVKVPQARRGDVNGFISDILETPVAIDRPAVILVNRARNTIVVTGDVRVQNAMISLQDKTVTIRPETEQEPAAYTLANDTPRTAIELDGPGTYADLQSLITTLNAMGLNTDQVITMFEQLREAGAIRADLRIE